MLRSRKVFFALMSVAALSGLMFVALRPVTEPPPSLNIDSVPPGASIFVNGRLLGQTPAAFVALEPGTYSLRLEKDGCEPLVRRIELANEFISIKESLIASPTCSLSVEVKPDNAEVLFDGHLAGRTPLKLDGISSGPHAIIVRKPNFEPLCKTIEFGSGSTVPVRGELKDVVEAMLLAEIKRDPQRVAYYSDYAHYLFIRDRLKESADHFVMAMVVSEKKMAFVRGTPVDEMRLAERHRAEDAQELRYQIDRHAAWPGKDTREFKQTLTTARVNLLKGEWNVRPDEMKEIRKLRAQRVDDILKQKEQYDEFKKDLEQLKRDLRENPRFRNDD